MVEVKNIEDIEVAFHVKKRHCERIIGLETVIGKEELERINAITNPKVRYSEIDTKIRAYITLNDERITDDIRMAFMYSDFIYKGSFGGDNTTKNFYLRDDIIIITEANRYKLITLYRVDFGFGEKNRELVQWMKDTIINLQDVVENTKGQVENEILELELENIDCDTEIKNIEARLDALRKLKKANAEAIEAKRGKITLAIKELESKVHQLCNNIDYKKDMMAGEQ